MSKNKNDKMIGGLSLALLLAGASILARKATAAGWSKALRDRPPPEQDNPEVSIGEAIGWAVVSGAAVGVARMLVRRSIVYPGSPTEDESHGGLPDALE